MDYFSLILLVGVFIIFRSLRTCDIIVGWVEYVYSVHVHVINTLADQGRINEWDRRKAALDFKLLPSFFAIMLKPKFFLKARHDGFEEYHVFNDRMLSIITTKETND